MKLSMNKRRVDATEGPLFSKMVIFAVPLMLTSLLQQLYSMADNIVVGQFSGDPNALGAVGSCSAFVAMLNAIFIGFSAGSGALCSQAFGAKDNEALSRTTHTALVFGLIAGTAAGTIGITFARPILIALDTKSEILDLAVAYISIIAAGMPGHAVYNVGASVLRSTGDSKTPLYTLTATGILNVVLNLFTVVVLKLSVAGVAIATAVSHYASAIIVLYVLYKRRTEPYALSVSKLRIDVSVLKRLLRLGIPASIQSSLFSFTNMFLIKALNTFPTPVVSARTIATNIDVLLSTAINTYLHTSMTFTGQNYGAKKPERIKKSLLYSLLQVIVLGLGVGQLMLLFYEPLVGLYVAADNPYRAEIFEAAKVIMTVMLSSYFIGAMNEALSGFLRGLGQSIQPMVATLSSVVVFRCFWIFVVFPYTKTLVSLYLVYPLSWILNCLALGIMCTLAWKKKVKPLSAKSEKL